MNTDLKEFFQEAPEFLSMLGFTNAYYDENKNAWVNEYMPTKKLTHSNGTIIQGGFVTGMIDACMSQFIMFESEGKSLPLTLDIDVKFLKSCSPNIKTTAIGKIIKKGKSVTFTTGELYQDGNLVAVASATNKIIHIKN